MSGGFHERLCECEWNDFCRVRFTNDWVNAIGMNSVTWVSRTTLLDLRPFPHLMPGLG